MTRPDFSGTYKLNAELSDFANLKAPRMRVDSVVHDEPSLAVTTLQIDAGGANSTVRRCQTDDVPVSLEVAGKTRQLRARWEGQGLVVETSWEHNGQQRLVQDTWHLSANRKQLVIVRRQEAAQGTLVQRFVLERESRGD